jgi:hypothetical protein
LRLEDSFPSLLNLASLVSHICDIRPRRSEINRYLRWMSRFSLKWLKKGRRRMRMR